MHFNRQEGSVSRSTSLAVGRSPRHTRRLTVKLNLTEEKVEAIVDTGSSASVVGKRLGRKLGI